VTEREHPGLREAIPTGFGSLDPLLGGGLRRQDLVVLGGDVGSGKSALALAVALRSAAAGTRTLLLSGEMSAARLLERTAALEERMSVDELRGGSGAAREAALERTRARLAALPIELRALADGGFGAIEAAVAAARPALLVVDALQQVEPPRPAPRQAERVAAAARALKALALRSDAAVLATAHLPALAPGRADPRPTLDDLGALGVPKQEADVVLGLYREEMYRPGPEVTGATELLVLKNRNGPTGFTDLYFYARWLRFEDMLDPER
jgi:replicative DNA helicase